ncbi:hypothetical protein HK405_012940, partial [Cladochytrium tenue]
MQRLHSTSSSIRSSDSSDYSSGGGSSSSIGGGFGSGINAGLSGGRKVLVAGGGPAGMLAALAMRMRGLEPVVFERQESVGIGADGEPQFAALGGAVMLSGNGLRVLARLGLLEAVLAASGGAGPKDMVFARMDGSGRVRRPQTTRHLATTSSTAPLSLALSAGGGSSPATTSVDAVGRPVQILRSSLQAVLMRACRAAGVLMFPGKRVAGVSQTARAVRLDFVDGSFVSGDFLVAADGIRSTVRTAVFPGLPPADRVGVGFLGVYDLLVDEEGSGGALPGSVASSSGTSGHRKDPLALYMSPLDSSIMHTVECERDGVGAWMIMQVRGASDPDAAAIAAMAGADASWRPYEDLPGEAARLAAVVESWGAPRALTDTVRRAHRIAPVHMYNLPDMPTLQKGRIVFVGDSGHGTFPTHGQGLNQALEDVGVLYELLGHFPGFSRGDHTSVLAVYDA